MTPIVPESIVDVARRGLVEQPPAGKVERQYQSLIEHSPVAMCVHVDGRYVYANQTMVRKLGARSADELLGRSIADFVHPDSLSAVFDQIASRQRNGDTSPPLEMSIVTLDGIALEVEALAVRTLWEGRSAHKVVFQDITRQKATEADLRFQAALVAHVSDAIISTTATGHVTSWNPAAEALYQWPAVDAVGLPIGGVVGADLDLAGIVAGGGVLHTTHRASEGSTRAVRVAVSLMDDGYVVLCTDQTELRRFEQHCQTVVASLQEGVVVITAEGAVESVNPAALRIFGAPTTGVGVDEIAKVADVPVYDSEGQLLTWDNSPLMAAFKHSPLRGGVYGIDRFNDGERIWFSINWSLLDPADPGHSALLVSIVDVTEQHNAHRRLAHQATHDVLTGIPNRARMVALINEAIGSDEYRWGAVLFIDLNKFKVINDQLGHHAGDVVLELTSQRLRAGIGPEDVVGRVGGDEFVVLLAAPIQRAKVNALVRRLHTSLRKPINIPADSSCAQTVRVNISASIGIVAVRPGEQRCAAEVLRAADAAMYRAKVSGGATCHSRDHGDALARGQKAIGRFSQAARN